MKAEYPFIVKDFPYFLHGGDYNPEQWLDCPEIIDEDFRLATLAGINSFTIGIFSWSELEPEEGRFEFDWLDQILDRMAKQNMKAVLATPSGAKPNWLAEKYPEVRRVFADGQREQQHGRHNHCYTSVVYREKVTIINTMLAQRYCNHPALGVWHLSNEYSGECYCPLCKTAFREWLKKKYGTLKNLNAAWWAKFWSHTYTDWRQIDKIDISVHGIMLDWKRFVSAQTADFIRHEAASLRKLTPNIPLTTNLMGTYLQLDYSRLAKELDLVSWDSYPAFHNRSDMTDVAVKTAFTHDLIRGLKGGKPFMLMESCPSATVGMPVNKLLRPGIHRLKSLQAVAHGADTIQYFQYRKSRGGCEKFHGAVIDHVGNENTRVFQEVATVGAELTKLSEVLGSVTPAEAAIIYDWENRWILEDAYGPRRRIHDDWVLDHYRSFWSQGVPVNVISSEDSFDQYKLVVAPMLYMLKPGVAERLTSFVRKGGTLVGTFLTGISDENDLCFFGGWPGPLRPVFGVWAEEIDCLYDDERNTITVEENTELPELAGSYEAGKLCDLIHAEGARVLARYGDDFYAGTPALACNNFGKGTAYYIAARTEMKFLTLFYRSLQTKLGLARVIDAPLPNGVTAQLRKNKNGDYLFIMNFTKQPQTITLGKQRYYSLCRDVACGGDVTLASYGADILKRI